MMRRAGDRWPSARDRRWESALRTERSFRMVDRATGRDQFAIRRPILLRYALLEWSPVLVLARARPQLTKVLALLQVLAYRSNVPRETRMP